MAQASRSSSTSALEAYAVEKWIGQGSYGSVSRIRRKADGQILVWKEVHYGKMEEAEKRMMVSEVNILRELRSPFVVAYHDRIVDRKSMTLFIVMEHCAGGDLDQLLAKRRRAAKPLSEAFIWSLAAQLLLGLEACHYRGSIRSSEGTLGGVFGRSQRDSSSPRSYEAILHRDIKPANGR